MPEKDKEKDKDRKSSRRTPSRDDERSPSPRKDKDKERGAKDKDRERERDRDRERDRTKSPAKRSSKEKDKDKDRRTSSPPAATTESSSKKDKDKDKSKDKDKDKDKERKASVSTKDAAAAGGTDKKSGTSSSSSSNSYGGGGPKSPYPEKEKEKEKEKSSSKAAAAGKDSKDSKKSGSGSGGRNEPSAAFDGDVEMGLSPSSNKKEGTKGKTGQAFGFDLGSKSGVSAKTSKAASTFPPGGKNAKTGAARRSGKGANEEKKKEGDDSDSDDDDDAVTWQGRVGPEEAEDAQARGRAESVAQATKKKLENALGCCTACLIRWCGQGGTSWLIRRRFVLFRVFICIVYFAVGVEYYHAREDWTRTEAVYFITVSTCTVGYGDYHPTTDSNRLFTTFYVIVGLGVVLSSANDVIQYFVVKKFQQKVLAFIDWCVRIYYVKCRKVEVKGSSLESKAWFKLVFSLSCVVGLVFFGTTFYATNEDLTIIQGLYWTMMTMLTVGYGDLSMTKDSTHIFSTWFIWLCVIIYIMAITNIWDTFEELKSEALRLEILKQHAVDIVDVLAGEGRKRNDTSDRGIGMGGGQMFEIFSIIKDGVTGAEDRGEDPRSVRRNSIKNLRKSIALGRHKPVRGTTFSGINPMRDENGNLLEEFNTGTSDNEGGIGGTSRPPPPPARPTTGADLEALEVADQAAQAKRSQSIAVGMLTPKDQVLEKAREDRFVLEMLEKINKQKYEREVEPLIVHFHKLERLRGLTREVNGSRVDMQEELFADARTGGLMGFASSLIGSKKAVVRKRASNFKDLQVADLEQRVNEIKQQGRPSMPPPAMAAGAAGAGARVSATAAAAEPPERRPTASIPPPPRPPPRP